MSETTKIVHPGNKEAWLRLLTETAIPSFNASIKALSSAEDYSSTHSNRLARTILKDPNLTTSVLKLANSAQFNASGADIRTISRAIMVLGHKAVKEVCASCLLMEQFLKQNGSRNMPPLIARSYHSAIQAKEIALMQGLKSTEEIFISALLMSLGELAVYSAVAPNSELSIELANAYPFIPGKEKELIGCYFSDLTLGLCNTWHIAPMIGELLGGHYAENSPVRSILLGSSVANASESLGIDGAIKANLKSITRYTKLSPEEVTLKLEHATEETQKSLHGFGIKLDVKKAVERKSVEKKPPADVKVDKLLQLQIIQELSEFNQEKLPINDIMLSLLEGIKRGGNYSCALIALFNRDKTRLSAKHCLDNNNNEIKQSFDFDCYRDIPEIHQKVITNRGVLQQSELRLNATTIKRIMMKTKIKNAVWGPLFVKNKVIGCFYANNGTDSPEVTQEQLEVFKLFVNQGRLLLQDFRYS